MALFDEMLRETVREAAATRRAIHETLRRTGVTFPADQASLMQAAQLEMLRATEPQGDIQDRIEAASTAWSMYSDVLAEVYAAADAAAGA